MFELIGYILLAAVVGLAVAAVFSPRVRQMLRIWSNKGVNAATTPVERAKDRVRQAQQKLPQVRQNVARLMTAAQRAQDAVTAKKAEADTLLGKYETGLNMKASQDTLDTLKTRWKAAKDMVPVLEKAAEDAAKAAEDAQDELEGYLRTIEEAEGGVQQLEADAQLAQIYRESAGLRNQVNDLKKGLGEHGADAKQVKDDLATARNENELSKGSAADREMAEIEKRAAANAADAEIEAALAARRTKQ